MIRAGQARAYADSVYEAVVRYSSDGVWASRPGRDVVAREARVLVHGW